ncbi:DUF4115 domain-containing protein [Vibrio sinensis]|uniref:DUF4115 domain-containing protein n=1 Tax=Vibrio sinensis TaxID=2302434 RepID=A0A3A6QPE6_9VIBR|nr:RodZ domain-containing protein [Vibrio sinensis]RJX74313.1 DUF4115 domain-containing protein [Vibrio sinensis]
MSEEKQTTTVDHSTIEAAGTILKNKRIELGLTQKQVADRLRLRVSMIENIENNQFESDQVATFTRGYLRSYAKVVGVPEAEVLCALEDCGDAQLEEQPMQSFSGKTKRERHDNRIMVLTWGIFAVILAISSVWWWQNQENGLDEFAVPADSTVAEVVTEVQEPADMDTVSDAVSSNEPELAVDANITEALPAETDNAATDTTDTPATTEATAETPAAEVIASEVVEKPVVANLLEMSFNDDCWIQVKDATGKTLATGIKKGGESLQLAGTAPYKVILGAPENVSMTLASEPVDLSRYTSGKVARFTLP